MKLKQIDEALAQELDDIRAKKDKYFGYNEEVFETEDEEIEEDTEQSDK